MQNKGFWASEIRPSKRIGKIVSVVPSQTELLSYFGLEQKVVGLTHFCVHPKEWHSSKTRVGGTKTLHFNKIRALKPDIILANKEENIKEQIEELAKKFPVYVTDVNDVTSALNMIKEVGEVLNRSTQAEELVHDIREELQKLMVIPESFRVAYLIWKDPYMTIGGDTFISHMLEEAKFQNVFQSNTRYPQITLEKLNQREIDFVFLSSEPYPFQQKHLEELQAQLTNKQIILVDGELFSWYGSRMLKYPNYVVHLHQQLKK